MTNRSKRTRKEQVLDALLAAAGGWVDGPDLANERVGGSEGHRRLRELRTEGHDIRERRHPDAERDIWQYRLAQGKEEPVEKERPVDPAVRENLLGGVRLMDFDPVLSTENVTVWVDPIVPDAPDAPAPEVRAEPVEMREVPPEQPRIWACFSCGHQVKEADVEVNPFDERFASAVCPMERKHRTFRVKR